jgi:DNA-directed RNA polymerase specialized sigma24 family protein
VGFAEEPYPAHTPDQTRYRHGRERPFHTLDHVLDLAADPAQCLELREGRRLLWASVDERCREKGLTQRERATLILTEYHHFSQEEIANVLGSVQQSVSRYLRDARRKLEVPE